MNNGKKQSETGVLLRLVNPKVRELWSFIDRFRHFESRSNPCNREESHLGNHQPQPHLSVAVHQVSTVCVLCA